MYIVEVLIEHPLRLIDATFSYLSDTPVSIGVRVSVSFNHRSIIGYVESSRYTNDTKEQLEEKSGFKYLYIQSVIDEEPLLNDELRELAELLSKLTLTSKILCLQTMLPNSLKPVSSNKVGIKLKKKVKLINNHQAKTVKQQDCVNYLKEHGEQFIEDIPYSKAILDKLVEQKLVEIHSVEIYREVESFYDTDKEEVKLTDRQQEVVDGILSKKERVSLIYGVTGSGKTEVYLALAKAMLKENKTVMMLVPEISLTPMMVSIFKKRFGNQVAILHSKLTHGEKYDEYRRIKRQEVKIVVGARSAIFAPLENIGLIIMDEEHDGSYKQENAPKYYTTQIAKIRAKTHHAHLVLGSATPSIESFARSKNNVYDLYEMKERINKKPLPKVQIVDMVDEMKHHNYSSYSKLLMTRLQQTIDEGNQAILLLNKRGYSSYLRCNDCGEPVKCPHCEVTLTYHRNGQLKCHYCDYSIPSVNECPDCHGKMKRIGYGTERIEEELEMKLHGAKVLRVDLDTTRKKNSHAKMLKSFENKEYNIMVGTQMISKGLDFENVTLAGVIDADITLNIPDFRANERTFQLLTQLAGRSGRGKKTGEVIIQTCNPDHYAIQCASLHDYDAFYASEMIFRQKAGYPPFYHLISILISSKYEEDLKKGANKIYHFLLKRLPESKVYKPTESGIYKLKDIYRNRILIKTTQNKEIYEVLNQLMKVYEKGRVQVVCDFNPYNFI